MAAFEKIPDKPLAIFNPESVMGAVDQIVIVLQKLNEFFDSQHEKIFFMIDTRGVAVSFDTLARNLNIVNRQNHLFVHPMIRETLVLTDNKMVTLAAKGLDSPVFGNVRVKVFSLMEDALNYVDSQLVAE